MRATVPSVINAIHLEGWVNPLPQWLVDAILDGRVTVHHGKGYQFLRGTVVNPQGLIIGFM